MRKLLSKRNCAAVLTSDCCGQNCCKRLSLEELKNVRERLHAGHSELEVLNGIASQLDAMRKIAGLQPGEYAFAGRPICRKALLRVLGVGAAKFRKALMLVNSGGSVLSKQPVMRVAKKRVWLEAWLQIFIDERADHTVSGRVLLPSHIDWTDVLAAAVVAFRKDFGSAIKPPSLSQLSKLRKEKFPLVRRSYVGDHEHCSVCGEFREQRMRGFPDKPTEAKFDREQRSHLDQQHKERVFLAETISFASSHPEQIVLWGTDYTRDLELGSIKPSPKALSGVKKVAIKLTAFMNLSTPAPHERNFILHHDSLTKDANLNVTQLMQFVIASKSGGSPSANAERLHVQLDGAPENVNGIVIAFAGWLAKMKAYKTIIITRLMVGHSHWLVSRSMFSCI